VKERRYTDVLFNQQVDGIIFMASGDDPNSLQELISRRMPVVVVDRILDHVDVDAVITDNHLSGCLAAKHLLENGHHRIGLLRGPSNVNPSAQRVIGFLNTLQESGVYQPDNLVYNGDFHSESGYIGCRKFLELAPRPTAIFACNDLMAIGALRAIHEQGLKVPDDISLIGHDDIEWASFTQPALTTIAQPIQELSELAIDLLLDRMKNPVLSPRRYTLPNRLIIRQSTRRNA
jgi:LacI family transcriptional regulator